MDNFLRKPLLCLFLGLALAGNSAMAYQKPSKPPAAFSSGGLIAFIRKGDVWIAGADDKGERPLTRQGNEDSFANLATDGRRFVCLKDNVNIVLFEPPAWQPHQVTTSGGYSETPTWLPGTNKVFAGRVDEDGNDIGLWLVDTHRHTARRLLPAISPDPSRNQHVILSPNKRYLGSFGGITLWLFLQVLDRKTGKLLTFPRWTTNGLEGGTDVAWQDDDHLLIASDPSDSGAPGGVRQFDLRTRRIHRWRYSRSDAVDRFLHAPQGEALAVELQNRVDLVAFKTGHKHTLPHSNLYSLCSFSPDGSQLLVLIPRPHSDIKDLYIVDIRTGARHLVARDATEAVWMQSER